MAADGSRASALSRSLAAATARVDELIREAQSIAEEICADAEREAERYLAERRRETDDLLSRQRDLIRTVFKALRDDLDAAERRAADAVEAGPRNLAGGHPGVPHPSAEAPPRPTVVADRGADFEAERRVDPGRARALVRVGQLAAMGRERAEIEALFRQEFGIDPPPGIVDQVLRA